MSRKEALICDKCGEIIPEGKKYYIVNIQKAHNVEYTAEITNEMKGDICKHCLKSFAIEEFTLRDEWGDCNE